MVIINKINNTQMKKILFSIMVTLVIAGCSKSGDEKQNEDNTTINIEKPNDISASYDSEEYTVLLSENLIGVAEAKIHDYNSDFIRNVKLSGNKISFWLEENSNTNRGYREGQIDIIVNGTCIQSFKVYQARNSECSEALQWCNDKGTFTTNDLLDFSKKTGKEITEYIYNLEKTTNGTDTYKNYPAFAYCIEMNHDLPNIEWYLPTKNEMENILIEKGYRYFKNKEFWVNYGSTTGAIAIKFSDNHTQCLTYKYSKQAYKNVHASR